MINYEQPIEWTVENLLRPRIPSAAGFLRCADLYGGDGCMANAAIKAGFEIAYAYDLDLSGAEAYTEKFGIEPFGGNTDESIALAPDFHVLLLRLSPDALVTPPQPRRGRVRRYEAPMEHAMRFLYVRRPVGVLLAGNDLPDGFIEDILNTIQQEMFRWGYAVESREGDGLSAIVGTFHTSGPFPWPRPLTLGTIVKSMLQATLVPGLRADLPRRS